VGCGSNGCIDNQLVSLKRHTQVRGDYDGTTPSFARDDQRLLEAFAASAATAVATAESVRSERRRQRLAAAEQERARWGP
jgi:hypothetical protein